MRGLLVGREHAGSGPQNVGFHVDHAVPADDTVRDVDDAGGTIVERGEHAPGVPFARIGRPGRQRVVGLARLLL